MYSYLNISACIGVYLYGFMHVQLEKLRELRVFSQVIPLNVNMSFPLCVFADLCVWECICPCVRNT